MKKIIFFLVKLGVICFIAIVIFIIYKEKTISIPSDFDSIIVLGAQVKSDGELSNQLKLRMSTALSAYTQNTSLIIVSGAQGENEPISEARAMKNWLLQNNVPISDIIEESESTNTRQNLTNAAKILKANNKTNPVIITSDYHLPRALMLAQDLGLNAKGWPAPTKQEYWLKNHAREGLAFAKYLIEKYILTPQ